MLKMSNEKPHHVVGFLLYRYGAKEVPNVFLNLTVILGGAVGLHRPEGVFRFPQGDHIGVCVCFIGEVTDIVLFRQLCIYLIGHHHTLESIHGLDYQILIEADYLVNADEASYSNSEIEQFMKKCSYKNVPKGTFLFSIVFLIFL